MDNKETKSEEEKYSDLRNSLFMNTLDIEEKAYAQEIAFSTRYQLNISILFSVTLISDATFLSTFNYKAFKSCFLTATQPFSFFLDLCIFLVMLFFLFSILGCYYGAQALLPKPSKFIDADKVKKKADQVNDNIQKEIDKTVKKDFYSCENNQFIHQQIVDFAGLAKAERAANERRMRCQAKAIKYLLIGTLFLAFSYVALSLMIL